MKILVVTNMFPPVVIGGYELGCAHQISLLRDRGHEVVVLTSARGRENAPRQDWVHRVLPLSIELSSPWTRLWREVQTQYAARRVLRAAAPDVTYVFNPRWISRSVLFRAQEASPVVYFVSDPWLADEMLEDGWAGPWQRRLDAGVRPLRRNVARAMSLVIPSRLVQTRFGSLDLEHATFSSDAVRRGAIDAGRPVSGAPIIHCAVDVAAFAPRPPVEAMRRFLYVGQLMPHKGVKTALTAFISLCRAEPERDIHLTLVGGSMWPHYEAELREFVDSSGMASRITFAGALQDTAMQAVYAQHDALIFPSEWQEPFSLVMLEAMAVGLPIVCTMTGGTPELVTPEHNALTFEAGDASACRRQMARLFDLGLARRLQVAARATVETSFTIEQMVDAVETFLVSAASS